MDKAKHLSGCKLMNNSALIQINNTLKDVVILKDQPNGSVAKKPKDAPEDHVITEADSPVDEFSVSIMECLLENRDTNESKDTVVATSVYYGQGT